MNFPFFARTLGFHAPPVASVPRTKDVEGDAAHRTFRRLRAPAFYAPAGLRIFHRQPDAVPAIVRDVRLYTDEALRPGARVQLEVFEGDRSVKALATVAWRDALPENAPARFDVGLTITHLEDADVAPLARALRVF
jgi:hypothetical protein